MPLTKKIAEKIIKKHFKYLKKLFFFRKEKIYLKLVNTNLLKSKKSKIFWEGQLGCMAPDNIKNKYYIQISFSDHKNEKELISTVIHELLHVKLSKISYYKNRSLPTKKYFELEEKLVLDLEKSIGILYNVLFINRS